MKIFFHSAAGDVTGSAYHVRTKHAGVLMESNSKCVTTVTAK
jgi:metallo-beta-lactamase family protein